METQDNKIIVQSYNFTTIRNDFGIHAQRLLIRIAEAMQYRLQDADFVKREFVKYDERLEYTFKIKDIAGEDTTNYEFTYNELKKVIQANVQYTDVTGKAKCASVIFTDIRAKNGEIRVRLNQSIWDLFIEFSKGYKRYELSIALALRTTYALRFYQLLNENETPITYSIAWLKELFHKEKSYERNHDFIKRVIEPAQKELNELAPISFDYKVIHETNGRGRPTIVAIEFTTRKTGLKFDFNLQEKEMNRKYGDNTLPESLRHKLEQGYNFDEQGIRANARLFFEAYVQMKNPTLLEFLDTKREKAFRAENPKGWIINAIKGELETL